MRLNLTTEIEWLSSNLILRSRLILHAAAALHLVHCKTTGIFHAARRCWSTAYAAAYAARLPSLPPRLPQFTPFEASQPTFLPGLAVRYGTPQFLLRSTVRWYGTPFLYWYGYDTLLRYASTAMVRVRCVGTLFGLKILDFLDIVPAFCIQRQRTAEADAKRVN